MLKTLRQLVALGGLTLASIGTTIADAADPDGSRMTTSTTTPAPAPEDPETIEAVRSLETQLAQLADAVDDERAFVETMSAVLSQTGDVDLAEEAAYESVRRIRAARERGFEPAQAA